MSKVIEKSTGGLGFAGALFIAFLVLKLCKVIAWSWWWVFAPLWAPIVLAIAILIIGVIITIISCLSDGKKPKKD